MIRVILDDSTTASDIHALSSGLCWNYQGKFTYDYSFEIVNTTNEEDCLVKYVDDKISLAKYIILSADSDDGMSIERQKSIEKETLAEILTRPGAISVVSGELLVNEFRLAVTDDRKASLLIRLAIDSVYYDVERFNLFQEELFNDNYLTAKAIILGIGYMGWSEWIDALKNFSVTTVHPELKTRAERMLSGFFP